VYYYGEALFHLRGLAPVSDDSIYAVFDRVLRADSTLVPAVIHELDLAIMYHDPRRFELGRRIFDRYASPAQRRSMDVGAALAWGRRPADSVLRSVLASRSTAAPLLALGAAARRPDFTSDSVLDLYRWAGRALQGTGPAMRPLMAEAYATAAMGRLQAALPLVDSLKAMSPGAAAGALAIPIGLGLAPPSYGKGRLEAAIAALPPSGVAHYARGFMALSEGRIAEGRRQAEMGLALGDTVDATMRGMLIGLGGWADLIEGDTTAGVQRLRDGIARATGPNGTGTNSFLRFQLALALSARPATRQEGILWLRYAFYDEPNFFVPISFLALGRAWEAAGERDSAVYAYGRFVRLWDKADPPLQGRVQEAREALARLSAEPRKE
jgi:hypothetical protein